MSDMRRFTDHHNEAEELRTQAASCRQLASNSRTPIGRTALLTLADQLEAQAALLDPAGSRW